MTRVMTKIIQPGTCYFTFAPLEFNQEGEMDISQFFIAGINYKKSEASVRGLFAINTDQYASILQKAPQFGLSELFVLSTCNRTEIYGFASSVDQLIRLLCSETSGDAATFKASAYIKKGTEAINHIFNVGAGLDSQILGDYEIVGQLKTAAKFSKEHGFVGAFSERLINSVLQASKQIKNNTQLSGGTVSVSFAAVQYIRNTVKQVKQKNILLLGVGKIGRNTCKNLVDYLETKNITLINRSPGKAAALATELGLHSASIDDIAAEIAKADIILTATNATEPVILRSHLEGENDKLIIDLSIPYNVEAAAQTLPNVQLVNVDELSKLKDETLKKREAEVPKAKAIIAELMSELSEWCEMRKHVPMLKDLKLKLKQIYTHPLYAEQSIHCPRTLEVTIQRVLNETAGKVKVENQKGCQYIAAINDFISAQAS
jgi:glutamyl-tRNA reductase